MQQLRSGKQRPYWHVDAKWIFGILAAFALFATLILYNLSRVTAPEIAPRLSAGIISAVFTSSSRDFDEEKTLADLREQFARTKKDTIQPIPDFPITISRSDVENLSVEELKIKIFRQITDPIYQKGVAGAAEELLDNPADYEEFANQAQFLNFFTLKTHNALRTGFIACLLVTIVSMLMLAFFSWRWGRLASPGSIMFLATLPATLLVSGISRALKEDGGGFLESLGPEAAPFLIAGVRLSFLATTLSGGALIILAGLGRLIFSRKKAPNKPPKTKS